MSKKLFFDLAAQAGIHVDYEPGCKASRGMQQSTYHCVCDAPHGKLFAGQELHSTGEIQGEEGTTATDWRHAVKLLRELIAAGFDDCTEPDCEFCHPDEE